MRRDTQHALLLLLGAVLLRVCADESVLRYVRPGHRWLVIAAGVVAVGLAVFGATRDLRGHAHAAGDGHDAVNRTSGGSVRSGDLYPPLPGGTLALGLGEVVDRAVWDDAHSVAGREVVVTGFLARRHGDTVLARMRISCCAADARPSMLRLRGTPPDGRSPGELVPDSGDRWLRVRGTVVPGTGNAADRYVPDLTVSQVTPVPAPPDAYEY